MESKTKFDEYREKNRIRGEREKNLAELKAKLKRAKDLEAVIPGNSDSYEEIEILKQERRLVSGMIFDLEDMIRDETEAIEDIDTPDYSGSNEGHKFNGIVPI